jgi:hypothetical protein
MRPTRRPFRLLVALAALAATTLAGGEPVTVVDQFALGATAAG